ncbi:MAG: zinc-ribbon domain containing protein [Phycisphaerae bacterium]
MLSWNYRKDNPHKMPTWYFADCLHLDYSSAVRADAGKQYCSICPRYWYINATIACIKCGEEFCFTAAEQKHWYEDLKFWVDSFPRHCPACRNARRRSQALRREYDRDIGAALRSRDIADKQRLARVIDDLCELGVTLAPKVIEARQTLARQILRRQAGGGGKTAQ